MWILQIPHFWPIFDVYDILRYVHIWYDLVKERSVNVRQKWEIGEILRFLKNRRFDKCVILDLYIFPQKCQNGQK